MIPHVYKQAFESSKSLMFVVVLLVVLVYYVHVSKIIISHEDKETNTKVAIHNRDL